MLQKNRQYWRDKTSSIIKTGAVQAALVALSSVMAWATKGPIGWITERIMEKVWDLTGDKLLRFAIRKSCLAVDLRQGQIRVRKIYDAKNNKDADAYWRNIGSI